MAQGPAADAEDGFEEFLQQEQSVPPPAAEGDASTQLAQLVACAQRQEQLLGKVCSLLVGLDEKMGRLASSQERLEANMANLQAAMPLGGAMPVGGGGAAAAGAGVRGVPRGQMVQPPGKAGPLGGGSGPGGMVTEAQRAEEQRSSADKLAADRIRIEEEGRRRAEELARKREEDEQRKREEMERQRIEEERRREEERLRKQQLEKKTSGLMSGLITDSGSGLFGDEDVGKKKNKGGLFDD
jgi:hypothetical protein